MRTGGAAAISFICALLAVPATASATQYVVDSTGDASDADVADAACATDANECTLRAAIEQSNANPGADEIDFDAGFTGAAETSTITTAGDLGIDGDLTIDGGNCGTSSAPKPCVGVALAEIWSANIFNVFAGNDPQVAFNGLSVTNGFGGIDATGGEIQVTNSWLGLDLAENGEGNVTGVAIGAFTQAAIGGDTAVERNVVASNLEGVLTFGDDGVISGNFFGTKPDGTTPQQNFFDLIVNGSLTSPAERNTIGGTPTASQAASAQCDGPCNVFAGSSGSGGAAIALQGDGGGFRRPAGKTAIAGNFIGIDRSGTGALFSSGTGVLVGDADDVTIGGAAVEKRNFLAGAATGIASAQGAGQLVIQNNFLGLRPGGNAGLGFGSRGALLEKGRFAQNRVGGAPPTAAGITISGNGLKAEANVFGVGTGGAPLPFQVAAVEITGRNNTLGGSTPAAGNFLSNPLGPSVVDIVGGDGNRLVANQIGTVGLPTAGPGVFIHADADGNKVGGDSLAEENVISGNDQAVEIRDDGSDQNRFLRNRGDGNDFMFLDLDPPDGPGNDPNLGPNAGIQAPIIDFADNTTANGRSRPGAVIRLFRFRDDGVNITGFVAQTVANSNGDWSMTYASVPNGTLVGASQTKNDSSSEFSELVRVR